MKSILPLTLAAAWLAGCATAPPLTLTPTLTLWDAAELGRVEVIRQHLDAGTDVNARGGITGLTALHQASFHGREEIAALLIEAGANVNAASRRGETPLHSTVYWEHRMIAQLLLANGAALDAKLENGQTPLDWAEQLGASSMTDLFRSHGANGGNSRGGQAD
ncbi:MAG: ankyrin repeat domain-containing protein [Verrucomicrobiota bacterium]|jgi:ankyrin repeat protein|nr:ankyrin repeat domain-containing protein [Verrucomicrobiota bacterium]MDP7048360.1 ankyrin repeat domain-containing protein [Verrucomicrobiota bacterium]